VGAGGAQEAFVKKEFVSEKAGEGWRGLNFGFDFAEFLLGIPSVAAREGDVGLIGAGFGNKSATCRRGCNTFLQKE
jgi:hypothetical protein